VNANNIVTGTVLHTPAQVNIDAAQVNANNIVTGTVLHTPTQVRQHDKQ